MPGPPATLLQLLYRPTLKQNTDKCHAAHAAPMRLLAASTLQHAWVLRAGGVHWQIPVFFRIYYHHKSKPQPGKAR